MSERMVSRSTGFDPSHGIRVTIFESRYPSDRNRITVSESPYPIRLIRVTVSESPYPSHVSESTHPSHRIRVTVSEPQYPGRCPGRTGWRRRLRRSRGPSPSHHMRVTICESPYASHRIQVTVPGSFPRARVKSPNPTRSVRFAAAVNGRAHERGPFRLARSELPCLRRDCAVMPALPFPSQYPSHRSELPCTPRRGGCAVAPALPVPSHSIRVTGAQSRRPGSRAAGAGLLRRP